MRADFRDVEVCHFCKSFCVNVVRFGAGLAFSRAMKLVWSVRLVLAAMTGMFVAQGVAMASPLLWGAAAAMAGSFQLAGMDEQGDAYPYGVFGAQATSDSEIRPVYLFTIDEDRGLGDASAYLDGKQAPKTEAEVEAVFLAVLSGMAGSDSYEAISLAIRGILGIRKSADSIANPWMDLAREAYRSGAISPGLLQGCFIFTPSDPALARYISVVSSYQAVGLLVDSGIYGELPSIISASSGGGSGPLVSTMSDGLVVSGDQIPVEAPEAGTFGLFCCAGLLGGLSLRWAASGHRI